MLLHLCCRGDLSVLYDVIIIIITIFRIETMESREDISLDE